MYGLSIEQFDSEFVCVCVCVCKMITFAVSDVSDDYSNKHVGVSNPHEHVVDEQVERPEISERYKRCMEISIDVE